MVTDLLWDLFAIHDPDSFGGFLVRILTTSLLIFLIFGWLAAL